MLNILGIIITHFALASVKNFYELKKINKLINLHKKNNINFEESKQTILPIINYIEMDNNNQKNNLILNQSKTNYNKKYFIKT